MAAKEVDVIKQAPVKTITGNKHDWLKASGIPESDWQYVDYIVSKESGWKPCAYYPSNLKWQHAYVKDRYGSYANAYNFWLKNKYY